MNDIVVGHGEFDANGAPLGIGGRSIGSIIRGDRGEAATTFWFSSRFGLRDITEEFWSEYERIGRCAWDKNHRISMIGDENRYSVSEDGKTRQCNWCGDIDVNYAEFLSLLSNQRERDIAY